MSGHTKIENLADKKTGIKNDLYIVAIGASAGGLAALQELFDNIPGESGLAYVIIQHLSPDYKSLMGEILSKHTSMKVLEAQEGMALEPNCVYLLPSKKTMTVSGGRLMLEDKQRNGQPNMAIDHFLTSLALDKGKNAIAIILSGTGTDGTRGSESIKNNEGIVIVQDPMTAEFSGMPDSVISGGFADFILPPEMIADELIEYLKETPLIKTFNSLDEKEEIIFNEILLLIRNNTDYDFTAYKKPTLIRRLAKRSAEKNVRSIAEYYAYLKSNHDEILALGKEFLINVTKFFRDEDAYKIIESQVIPSIFLNKQPGDYIKFWVAACSTGEEAYSMAILVQEYLDANKKLDVNIKIFATDIDPDALAIASRGVYSYEALKHLPAERFEKYFVHEGKDFSVSPQIRKMVVFAKHNLVKDPPFSKINFLSCRNMLIYINTNLQKNVLKRFHFGLNDGGYLMLGPSENLNTLADYFSDVDKKWKIYKCIIKSQPFDHENYMAPAVKDTFLSMGTFRTKNAHNDIAEIFKSTLLEEYKLAGIYIDKDFEVKHAIGSFKDFISFPDDKLNFNLLKLVSPDLSISLSMAVRKALKTNERVVLKGIKVLEGDRKRTLNLLVKPFTSQIEYLHPFLFIILEVVNAVAVKANSLQQHPEMSGTDRLLELERETNDLRDSLQAVVEEAEATNEELQASNEEIISANEELQSTNEELQSVNEELHTVNSEYQSKIKELTDMNDDQNNYFNNTDIGQIFVDRKLIIRKFTPAATQQINLIPTDIGRSVADISTNFERLEFLNRIKEVMKTGNPFSTEVVMENGRICQLRITPYVRQDKTADGAVINFIDVTEAKKLSSIIEAVFDSSPSGIIALKALRDKDLHITGFEVIAANKKINELCGKPVESMIGSNFMGCGLALTSYCEEIKHAIDGGKTAHTEYYEKETKSWIELTISKMMDGAVLTLSDITQKKKADSLLMESFDELKKTSDELGSTNLRLERSNYDLVQFASVASHDLKEPLRKIQVFGSHLKEKVYHTLPPSEKNYLDKIIGASNRMQNLIEDVLTLSKLSNNDKPFEPTDLNEILTVIVDDLDIAITEKNALVHFGKLPVLKARPGQMRQLFQNLISNSLKFTAGNQPVISITASMLNDNEKKHLGLDQQQYYCLQVTDNGIGFEDKYSSKIFSLFQRLNGNAYPGTGLGLAICKKIVENHNGFIKVRSELGKGSVFTIILPDANAAPVEQLAVNATNGHA